MKVYGLIGEKLEHSLSPEIHKGLFEALDMNASYNLFSVKKERVYLTVESLKTLGIDGANVTIPYKEEIMKNIDFVSDEARKIGAINTISIHDGKSYGYNTDYYGFKKMLLKDNVKIEGNDFYVLGSGGASKAIVHLLLDENASKVVIVSRDKFVAQEKFRGVNLEFLNYSDMENIDSSYAVVNTTPCGMFPNIDTTAIDKQILTKFKVACDIVYNPEETRFLREARKNGLKTVKGLYMLVAQAMKSEEIWNNIIVDEKTEGDIFNVLSKKFKL